MSEKLFTEEEVKILSENKYVNEILSYNVSDSLKPDIATDTLHKLKKNRSIKLHKDAFIH